MDTIFESEELIFQFFDVAMLAPCLCVCRCSPTQKADIVRLLKQFSKGKRVKYENRFTLKNGSYAYVACYDWAKGTYPDQMRVGLTHSEFDTWIYKQIN